MIVLDIETSGLHPEKHGIWQIGAVDFLNPNNTFLEESRIDDKDEIEEVALKVNGKTEVYLRNPLKQSQAKLLERFFNWTESVETKNSFCQNPQFDLGFITTKARKYGLRFPLHHRAYDLHSIASIKYHQVHGSFLIKDNHSDMGLSNILKFCGLTDNRQAHNALEDASLTTECLSRIIHGKSSIKEYSHHKIPEYLQ
jgi:DNA polymerase III epsilon subunit-like protein